MDRIRDIVERLTVQNRDVLLTKYDLKGPMDHKDLRFYGERGVLLGQRGRVFKNKTTGPCLLGVTDIDRIKRDLVPFDEIIRKQPTLQNVLNVGYQASGDIRICMETHEFASLAQNVFGVEYDAALKGFKEVADRTQRIIAGLHTNISGILHFHFTHEPRVDRRLREITEDNSDRFLSLMARKKGEKKVLARIRKQLDAGRDPNDMFKLRIYSTYTPGWWGEKVKSHTLVENIYNINTYIDPELNPSWAALVPLRSLEWKREMAQGTCAYVGTSEDIEDAVEKLASIIPRKSPYHCNIGNIIPYAVNAPDQCDTLLDCFNKRDLNPERCQRCLDIVSEFLRKMN